MSAIDTTPNAISRTQTSVPRSPSDNKAADRYRCCPLFQRDNRDQDKSPYSVGDWTIKQCSACRFVYLENALEYEALVEDYCWTKTFGVEREARRRAEPVISRLSSLWKTCRSRLLRRKKELQL